MKRLLAAAAVIGLIGYVGIAHADDTPSKEQMAKIESALKDAGFTKWEKVEIDNGHFEVDDAIDASGKKYDLRIDEKTMKITSKMAD